MFVMHVFSCMIKETYGKIVVLGCWCLGSRLIIYEAFKSMCPPQSISTYGHPFNELQANITGIQKSFKMSKWEPLLYTGWTLGTILFVLEIKIAFLAKTDME